MALNGISTATVMSGLSIDPVATRILRREQKLALAIAKRSLVNTDGYRNLNDLGTDTHVAYVLDTLQTLSGTASPREGHPWWSDFTELEEEILGDVFGIELGTEDGNILG
jgi:hypothetical protein